MADNVTDLVKQHKRATSFFQSKALAMKNLSLLLLLLLVMPLAAVSANDDDQTVRVFIFAGQSNMVGTHSRVSDIKRFPPFDGLQQPQENVLFSYKLGREQMKSSTSWIPLQPTGDYFGPELSFGRRVAQQIQAPIAIIKVASGGTTLGEDWNPDTPEASNSIRWRSNTCANRWLNLIK